MEEMFEADVSEYASALICDILYVNAPASEKSGAFLNLLPKRCKFVIHYARKQKLRIYK